ncbi:phospholipase A2 inhibitor and Ly6/PLAUR domain-containing protein-like [Podarcis raffonei]|uniref:phospholipase A2 inhibitor and Ly6/PLAUR domain-containing protein-like n=1 Tax=Podarcis raffonei TaxID=65483 RepID=UPI0023294775|nr:phospholipase A2 inhibitor and Ly6/PLAUR domain-containing protein-like [Podarcis raffonei]
MEMMNFGKSFLRGIDASYADQQAMLIVNNAVSENVKLQKGEDRVCPLLPLLFILVLKTLVRNIRSDEEIKGITVECKAYKPRAFADDLVMTVEDPLAILPLKCRFTYNNTGMTYNSYLKTTCDSKQDSCVASVLRTNIRGHRVQLLNKCTTSYDCFSGNYSFTAGDGKFFEMKKHCCNTQLCNNATLSLPDRNVLSENGLKCPTCFSKGATQCKSEKTINCLENETQCVVFKGSLSRAFTRLQDFTFQGCGTTDFCAIHRRKLGSGGYVLFITEKRCYNASGISHQPEHEG